jgi:hypothetical protein
VDRIVDQNFKVPEFVRRRFNFAAAKHNITKTELFLWINERVIGPGGEISGYEASQEEPLQQRENIESPGPDAEAGVSTGPMTASALIDTDWRTAALPVGILVAVGAMSFWLLRRRAGSIGTQQWQ